MHSIIEVERALALAKAGRTTTEIAELLGVNRTSIREWTTDPSRARRRGAQRHSPCPRCGQGRLDATAYVYLLGMYLGDGTVSFYRNGVARLRIFQTACYPDLIAECAAAMGAVLPNRVATARRAGCVEIGSYSTHWPCLFPQVGPGRKHERLIELADWQQPLVDRHPELLLRGLIHSDGCRSINRIRAKGKVYEYPRYQFTNASKDIMRMFTDGCDAVGVHWTVLGPRDVAVSRRADVALLDEFIGPKT